MDRFDTLRIFVRVAEAGSFTKAADGLHIPRSTVSTAIQELEARVGARLLHRTTRRVTPTQDGMAFYERCVHLMGDLEEVETLFRRSAAKLQGKLRINVPSRLASRVIAPALPEFFQRYPGIELEMGVTDRPIDLIQEGVDCVVRVGVLADSRLVARRVGDLKLINCASPDYLARHGTPGTIADLAEHVVVNFASPLSGWAEGWEYIENGALMTLPMRSHVSVNDAETYIACCLGGLGLIQIPAYDVRDHLDAGRLVEVLPERRAAPMPITLLYPHRRHLSQRLQAFVEWLTALFQARLQFAD